LNKFFYVSVMFHGKYEMQDPKTEADM